MLMALFVLVGFGLLFMFAFDEGMQGADQSIESFIAHQAKEIEGIKRTISHGEAELRKAPALVTVEKELKGTKRENQFREGMLGSLKQGIAAANNSIAAKTKEFEAYKDEYRTFARSKAKGQTIERLETRTGIVYEKVTIRQVTPIGIQILYDGGQKRINFEDLPPAMQDHYQFDPKQKAAAVAKEDATRNEHEAAVSVATAAESQQLAAQRKQDAEATREKAIRSIAMKETRIETLKEEIEDLEDALPKEALKRISRAPQMRAQVASKRRDIATLQGEIYQLQSGL